MLAQAQERGADFTLIARDMMSAEPLDLPAESVDLVLFCLTLEHVIDPLAPLRDAQRILKPCGQIEILEIHPFLSLHGVAAHFEDEDGWCECQLCRTSLKTIGGCFVSLR